MTDTTDNAELRELIQQWRNEYAEQKVANKGAKGAMHICADELEALLEPDEAGELLAAAKNDDRSAEEVWESQQELNEE